MLFDALINLFKTICIGVIAFSPLIIYKVLDEPSGVNVSQNLNVSSAIDYSNQEIEKKPEESNGSNPTVFQDQKFFSGTSAPPPPPVQGEDAPIDNNIWILLFAAAIYGIFKYGKINLRKYVSYKMI